MVHLAKIPNDADIKAPPIEGVENLTLQHTEEDAYTSSVYGSKFAAQDLPQYEMPEGEMPKEVAYRMIKSGSPGFQYPIQSVPSRNYV